MKGKTMNNIQCGSAYCSGGHTWLFKGTQYKRLDAVNCYREKSYTKEELAEMNGIQDLFGEEGKPLWAKIRKRKGVKDFRDTPIR